MQTSAVNGLETVGGRIRAARKAKNLKLTKVAAEIGVSRTAFTAWENNAVKRMDGDKLYGFAQICDVTLDWLLERKGGDPDLSPPKPRSRKTRETQQILADRAKLGNGSTDLLEVPLVEVTPSLTAHHSHIDMTPRNLWTMPHDILELGFHAEPETTVVKRVVTRSPDVFGMNKGDYVLIDAGRTRIDEPGIYLITDPEGKSAYRALVILNDSGVCELASIADDLMRDGSQFTLEQLIPLGRVMGIFKPL